jgi:SAM-dependent methyltransferase
VPRLERLRFAVSFLRGIPLATERRALLARVRAEARPGYRDPARVRRYARRSRRRARREAELLAGVLATLGLSGVALDVPTGSGRMAPLLARAGAARVLLADSSPEMLAAAPAGAARDRIAARAERLPLGDSSVELTLCMRFLHHLEPAAAAPVLAELARVSGRWIVVSFFHPLSAHGLSRGLRSLATGRRRGRWSVTTRALARTLRPHGFVLRRAVPEAPFFHELWVAVFERERAPGAAGVPGRGGAADLSPAAAPPP